MLSSLELDDPRQLGPYRLLGRLGSGAMGRVYLGGSADDGPVAVRLFRSGLVREAGFRDRLAVELAAVRTVTGPRLARVVGGDPYADPPWMATAYVPGPSLADVVKEQGSLPGSAVTAVAAGLAEALRAIHAAGLLHKDLKPSNVLLAEDGPRVIDFGISPVAGDRLTATGAAEPVGYLSPEVVKDAPAGPPSDVFSLGAVLTFAATGKAPFGSGSLAAVFYRLTNGEPDLGRMPGSLRALIEPCLRKDPAARPTAADLLAELATAAAAAPAPTPDWSALRANWVADVNLAAGPGGIGPQD